MTKSEGPLIVSLQVGTVRELHSPGAPGALDQPWRSAVFKEPAQGPVWLGTTGLQGDAQADLKNHGGPDKAVLVNAAAHYPLWRSELGRPDIPYGTLAENFTVAGLTEESVCVGDIYAVGGAKVQVSQPRQPCWKMSRRLGVADLDVQIQVTGRTGWYLRVLQEGPVAVGDELRLLERPYPQWRVSAAHVEIYRRPADKAALRELSRCPALSARLREYLAKRAESGQD